MRADPSPQRPVGGRALGLATTATGWLALARLLHLTRPTPALLARLRRPAPAGRGTGMDVEAIRWAIAAASRRAPWRCDCMMQALAGKLWLDRLGVATTLRLGAAADGRGGLAAHVWLEVDGRPVTGGRPDPALAPFNAAG